MPTTHRPLFSARALFAAFLLYSTVVVFVLVLAISGRPIVYPVRPNVRVQLERLTVQLLQQGSRYRAASPEQQPRLLNQMFALAQHRAELLGLAVERDPAIVLRVSLPLALQRHLPRELTGQLAAEEGGRVLGDISPPWLRDQLPPELGPQLEQEVALEGELEVLHADDFTTGRSALSYAIRETGGRRYTLHFAEAGPQLMTGSRVKLKGVKVGERVAVARASGADFQVTYEVQPGHTVKKVAVILFNFTDNAAQPQPPEAVRQLVFMGSPSVNSYYREASFNQLSLEGKSRVDGDVFGWYTIGYPSTTCSYSTWASAAQQLAKADGFQSFGYNHLVYAFPRSSACGWGGLGTMGGSPGTVWINGNFSVNTFGHEIGHNLGAHHASALNCTDPATGLRVPLSSSCTTSEYGDPFDIMALSTYHTSNFLKGRLNWLPIANTVTVTTSGTYSLLPQEPTLAGPQVLRVPRDYDSQGNVTTYYYLEYRQPYGAYDTFSTSNPVANGVSIRLAPAYTTLQQSRLLDAAPQTTSFSDAALSLGQAFVDTERGISFTTLSVSPGGAEVAVALGEAPCVAAAPRLTVNPTSQWGAAGQTIVYQVTVANADTSTCAPATFILSTNLPAGFSQDPASATLQLSPGANQTLTLSVTSPASTPDGFYNIGEVVQHSAGLAASVTTSYNVSTTNTNPALPTLSVRTTAADYTLADRPNVSVTAIAQDAVGVSLSGVDVTFTITRPDGSTLVRSVTTKRTGEAATSLRLRAGDPVGTYTVLAEATSAGVKLQASTTFTVR